MIFLPFFFIAVSPPFSQGVSFFLICFPLIVKESCFRCGIVFLCFALNTLSFFSLLFFSAALKAVWGLIICEFGTGATSLILERERERELTIELPVC